MSDRESCPNVDKCPLFPKFQLDSVLSFWQATYCHSDFERCERYRSMKRGVKPPVTLLPNGTDIETGVDDIKAMAAAIPVEDVPADM